MILFFANEIVRIKKIINLDSEDEDIFQLLLYLRVSVCVCLIGRREKFYFESTEYTSIDKNNAGMRIYFKKVIVVN